jgi:myo-inositol-1(or 4)-monophosphatase
MCSFRFGLCCIWKIDGYFHNKINLWDIAAGALIGKEAGGIINDLINS